MAAATRKPHSGNIFHLVRWRKVAGLAAQSHTNMSQVSECQNANFVSRSFIFSIYDGETTQMYSRTQTQHAHTSSKSPLGFTEVYLISLEGLSSASLILALAQGIWSVEAPALSLHPAILPSAMVCRW